MSLSLMQCIFKEKTVHILNILHLVPPSFIFYDWLKCSVIHYNNHIFKWNFEQNKLVQIVVVWSLHFMHFPLIDIFLDFNIYLVSNFRTQGIHCKLEKMNSCPPLGVNCHMEWCYTYYNISFLHFILNVSIELYNQSRGIFPLRTESLLVRIFRPTFLVFDFKIENFVCRDVKILLKFIKIYSSK